MILLTDFMLVFLAIGIDNSGREEFDREDLIDRYHVSILITGVGRSLTERILLTDIM